MAESTTNLIADGLYAGGFTMKEGRAAKSKASKKKVGSYVAQVLMHNGYYMSKHNDIAVKVFIHRGNQLNAGLLIVDSCADCKTYELMVGELNMNVWWPRSAASFIVKALHKWWEADGQRMAKQVDATMMVLVQQGMVHAWPHTNCFIKLVPYRANFMHYLTGQADSEDLDMPSTPIVHIMEGECMDGSHFYFTKEGATEDPQEAETKAQGAFYQAWLEEAPTEGLGRA